LQTSSQKHRKYGKAGARTQLNLNNSTVINNNELKSQINNSKIIITMIKEIKEEINKCLNDIQKTQ
jgi:hypothetical protein